jgi:hypothetical protein
MRNQRDMIQRSPYDIIIVASLMILFGLAEVVTGITHQFFGLTTAQGSASTYAGAAIGLLYVLSGLFLLPLKKWGALFAILCLAVDVAGRIAMVVAGFYPIDSFRQTFAIFLGTSIAVIFAIYIGIKWKVFR